MKKSTDKKEVKTVNAADTTEEKGIFGRFAKRKRDRQVLSSEEKAKTFAEHIEAAMELLPGLIDKKQVELETEKGDETYNRSALSKLLAIQFHLDQIEDIAASYGRDQ